MKPQPLGQVHEHWILLAGAEGRGGKRRETYRNGLGVLVGAADTLLEDCWGGEGEAG